MKAPMASNAYELFTEEQVSMDSPKLAWLKKHGIITLYHTHTHGDCPPMWFAGFQVWWPELSGVDFFAEETAHNGDSRIGSGESEDEALASLMTSGDATRRNLRLWNEEP